MNVPGAQVRSRREFVAARPPAVRDTPASPMNGRAAQLPRGDRPSGGRVDPHARTGGSGSLRVLITANVGRGLAAPVEAQFGYVITDAAGRVVGGTVEKQRLTVSRSNGAGSASFVSVVGLKPGDYNLRVAAVDSVGAGRQRRSCLLRCAG